MGVLQLTHGGAPSSKELDDSADIVIRAIQGTVGLATTWPVGDDDPIGRARHVRIRPGQEPVLTYKGEGADYRIRFKVRSF